MTSSSHSPPQTRDRQCLPNIPSVLCRSSHLCPSSSSLGPIQVWMKLSTSVVNDGSLFIKTSNRSTSVPYSCRVGTSPIIVRFSRIIDQFYVRTGKGWLHWRNDLEWDSENSYKTYKTTISRWKKGRTNTDKKCQRMGNSVLRPSTTLCSRDPSCTSDWLAAHIEHGAYSTRRKWYHQRRKATAKSFRNLMNILLWCSQLDIRRRSLWRRRPVGSTDPTHSHTHHRS